MMTFWVATDADGSKYIYENKPEKYFYDGEWQSDDGLFMGFDILLSSLPELETSSIEKMKKIKEQTFDDEPIKIKVFGVILTDVELV